MKTPHLFNISRTTLTALLATVVVQIASVSASAVDIDVIIGGTHYTALLEERTARLERAIGGDLRSNHYWGRLHGEADSWVSLSRVDGNWQGIASVGGQLEVIDGTPSQSGSLLFEAPSPQAFGTCASPSAEVIDDHPFDVARASVEIDGQAPVTLPATYSENCVATVDGVCLLAELEMAFDAEFQQDFPTNFTDQAASLVNMVEGYYRNDLNIAFDLLTLEFVNGTVFSNTTNADDLLDDVRTKKDSNQLSFVQNRRALFHLVTGRDFDSTTAGIAYLGVACSFNFNAGLSRLAPVSNPSIPISALITAHEIGHNLGAVHDGDDNACATGFIMAPAVNPAATSFSSCSIDEIIEEIDLNQANLDNCFNYPVDVGLTARADNPTDVDAGDAALLRYDVSLAEAGRGAASIDIDGAITSGSGQITSASANGSACNVAANGLSYACNVVGSSAPVTLEVSVSASAAGTLGISAQADADSDPQLVDMVEGNASDISTLTVNAVVVLSAPTSLNATAGSSAISLSWSDSNTDEDGFRIERNRAGAGFTALTTLAANSTSFSDSSIDLDTEYEYRVVATANGLADSPPSNSASATVASLPPPPPPSSGGGGGGGAGDWMLLLLAALALLRYPGRAPA